MTDPTTHANPGLVQLIREGIDESRLTAEPDPRWTKLRGLGTELWLDTGDMGHAEALWNREFTALTTNNSLLNKEIQKGLYDDWIPAVADQVRAEQPGIEEHELVLEIAFALNARHGLRLVQRFGARVSVELHTDLADDVERSVEYGMRYAAMSEDFIVKVPLTPSGLVAARRLEDAGVPVNFTLGFSARQNYLIACVARPHWVNVFLGRLNAYAQVEGLSDGRWVGERTTLASQAGVRELRERIGVPTRQIAASLRSGEQVRSLAGLDVYTMPVAVAEDFLASAGNELRDRTGEDYRPNWNGEVASRIEGLNNLWELPDGLRAHCEKLAATPTAELSPEAIEAGCHEAGLGGLFPRLTDEEHARIRLEGKAPKRKSWLASIANSRAGLDALFTLAGLYAFAEDQAALDARILQQMN